MAKTKKPNDTFIITKQQFATSAEFSQWVEQTAVDKKIGLMDTIIDFCAKNDIDVEVAAKLITRSLKEKIRVEAISLNYMPKKTHTIDSV